MFIQMVLDSTRTYYSQSVDKFGTGEQDKQQGMLIQIVLDSTRTYYSQSVDGGWGKLWLLPAEICSAGAWHLTVV